MSCISPEILRVDERFYCGKVAKKEIATFIVITHPPFPIILPFEEIERIIELTEKKKREGKEKVSYVPIL